MCRVLENGFNFSFNLKGAQGETGSKGERGDPGLPVSIFLTFFN